MAHLRDLYAMTLIEGLPEELRLDSKDDLGQYTQNIKGQLISKCPFGVFKSKLTDPLLWESLRKM